MLAESPAYIIVLMLATFLVAIVMALFEIQIEGPHGWANVLPTWRSPSQLYQKLFNGRILTGYHFYLTILLLAFFHFPLLLSGWSLAMEWTLLSMYFFFQIIWDFLWFLLNPYFGWQRFSKGYVWWFRTWWGYFPADYYSSIAISGCFAALRGWAVGTTAQTTTLPPSVEHVMYWAIGLVLCLLCTFLLTRVYHPKRLIHFSYHRDHRDPDSTDATVSMIEEA